MLITHAPLNRFRRTPLLLAFAFMNACAVAPDAADEESVETTHSALTAQETILGFENATTWTASAGVRASTTVHTQGATALSIKNIGYSELVSPSLSTLSGVTSKLAIDVRPPAVAGWGTLQILVTSATLGLSNAWVGQASLQGLAANTFSEVTVDVPSTIQQKLAQSYSDLKIKVVLNVPTTSVAYVIDNLHFKGSAPPVCGTGSPYTLVVSGQAGVDPTVVENLRCTFFATYPALAARFNPAAPTTVGLVFSDLTFAPAWAANGEVSISKAHIASNPQDTDVLVHEGMHIIQGGADLPGWIIEGQADYVREEYGLSNVGWSIPSGYSYGQHYVQGYGTAAAFFQWVDANYRQGQTPVVDALDDIGRQNQYSEQTWVTLTGHDVDWLWRAYSGNTAPLPFTSGIKVFEHDNFGGRGVFLERGSYTVDDLGAYGIGNDWISSLQVPAGYTVTVYWDSPFTGDSLVYTSDVSFVGETWNDKISSIVVQ